MEPLLKIILLDGKVKDHKRISYIKDHISPGSASETSRRPREWIFCLDLHG